MRIPSEQSFVPVILGGDIGTYSLAREFHQEYGAISAVVPSVMTGIVDHSRILDARPFADQDNEAAFLDFVISLGRELSAGAGGPRPLLLLGGADQHIRFIARNAERLRVWFTVPYVGEEPAGPSHGKGRVLRTLPQPGHSLPGHRGPRLRRRDRRHRSTARAPGRGKGSVARHRQALRRGCLGTA